LGDDISSLYGVGAERPVLAWPMTIAMLALAGLPGTAGFFGKIYLIGATVDNGYGWLGVIIVVGSAISLAYYMRVIAAVWMRPASDAVARPPLAPGGRPAIAGGSAEADVAPPPRRSLVQIEVLFVAILFAAASIVFGIYPDPLLQVARDAASALSSLV
jgi:NADH-quinone oxidoreductase subunit N